MGRTRIGTAQRGLVCVALVLAVLAVYGGVGGHAFVDLDDGEYVYDNARVQQGLSWPGIAWAFALSSYANWHPVTWLSHMADVQMFGLHAGRHHLTSVALHAANAVLLFLVLGDLTGAMWRSALVAALFALHPLHVESVAWVSERKDVLSTFFWLLTLAAYSAYARRGGAARYAGVLAAFVLGLMSKAMLVTLPLVLLLLDYWPLGRLTGPDTPAAPAGARSRLAPLVREKLPLFALTAVFSVIAFVAQRSWGATAPLAGFPLDQRLANALVSYAAYLGKMVYPASLAAFYPHPASVGAVVSPVAVVVAAAVLAVISAVALAQRTTRPWLIVGWLWYVVTLLPVIGVVQIGAQAMADRYTYVPLIGIFVMLVWTIPAAVEQSRALRAATAAVAGAVLLGLSMLATMQVGYWRDGVALYTHAIAVTKNNWLAWNNLGMQRLNAGELTAALDCFREAVRIKADYADGWYNAGVALLRLGRYPQAIAAYRYSLELEPNNADGWTNLGLAYVAQRDFRAALAASGRLRAIDPARSNELLNAIAAAMQAAPPATASVPRRTP